MEPGQEEIESGPLVRLLMKTRKREMERQKEREVKREREGGREGGKGKSLVSLLKGCVPCTCE